MKMINKKYLSTLKPTCCSECQYEFENGHAPDCKNQQAEIVNGAYYCKEHKVKNCLACFEQPASEECMPTSEQCTNCGKHYSLSFEKCPCCSPTQSKPEQEGKYTVKEFWDSLYHEFVDCDEDFDGKIHITSVIDGSGTTIDLKEFMQDLLKQERERIYNHLSSKQEFVTYKKDDGHGVAVPMAYIVDLLESEEK